MPDVGRRYIEYLLRTQIGSGYPETEDDEPACATERRQLIVAFMNEVQGKPSEELRQFQEKFIYGDLSLAESLQYMREYEQLSKDVEH